MPFPLAHPAAVIALHPLLRRRASVSALVIGSITPDLWNIAPFLVSRDLAHSTAGLLLFCIPAGLLLYLLFHLLLKRPLLALAPDSVSARLASCLGGPSRLPRTAPAWVLISFLLGWATHIAWDAFTHRGAPGVQAIPALQRHLVWTLGYHIYVYTVIQHLSSVLGSVFVLAWVARWLRSAPVHRLDLPLRLSRGARRGIVIALLGLALAAALWSLLAGPEPDPGVYGLHYFIRRAAQPAIAVFCLALIMYSALWHWAARPGRR
jgi:hypothetical protein